MIKNNIIKALKEITGIEDLSLETPTNLDYGDYSTNLALKDKKIDPNKITEKINSNTSLPITAKVVGKFINFYVKNDVLIDNLIQIDGEFGKTNKASSKKIMFEFAHPNTHKAFHIGHLRNITTGECLSRLHEAIGAMVIRANYQGDVGLHIAKAVYGIQLSGFEDPKDVKKRAEYLGKVYAIGATKFEESNEAKEVVGNINKKIYDKSDAEINKLYETTRKWSLDYFDSIYKRVYTKFDRLYFESETADRGKEIALEAVNKGILVESDGAIIFEGSKYGLHDRVFISGKGVPTYEAKDLGLAELQFKEYQPEKIIHTVGPEQTEYFKVVFKALEYIQPDTKGREVHVPYGWVKLKKGKMSSRTGNVILGEDVLDQAKQEILEKYKIDEKIAEQVAVGAVKYSFLKHGLTQEIAFDLQESISLEGNSGPYIQYAIARCNSILAKLSVVNYQLSKNLKLNNEETAILRSLVKFPEIVENSALNYSPNLLCNYLYDLASKFNTFYAKNRILGLDFRIMLTEKVGMVLKSGFKLLGIESPLKM
jgi:arginyl-tRNA synthetase